jgi:hypothetical protein
MTLPRQIFGSGVCSDSTNAKLVQISMESFSICFDNATEPLSSGSGSWVDFPKVFGKFYLNFLGLRRFL